MKNNQEMVDTLKHGTVQIIPEAEFAQKLARGKPLNIKLGMDPTSPDLHLGHAVVLSKLRQFQDAGHNVIFLIGDFTARIGDPTGKSKTRPPLTEAEILHNTKTYFEQVSKILDPNKVRVCYNSQWLDALSVKDMVKLCGKVTLARLTEREDFANRIANHQPIGFHELLYPLFQGYDSVALHADVELGGTDQTFNLLIGRLLQEQYGQEPQVIMTVPLLEGLDGHAKMSKSLGNAIGLIEPADQAFGKLMSISDTLMWRYASLLLHTPPQEIKKLQDQVAAGTLHPMQCKKDIARSIVAKFWSPEQAEQAYKTFEQLFQKKDYEHAQVAALPVGTANPLWIVELVKLIAQVASSSEARRLIQAGAVEIDGEIITDVQAQITVRSGMMMRVGKHRIYRFQ